MSRRFGVEAMKFQSAKHEETELSLSFNKSKERNTCLTPFPFVGWVVAEIELLLVSNGLDN